MRTGSCRANERLFKKACGAWLASRFIKRKDDLFFGFLSAGKEVFYILKNKIFVFGKTKTLVIASLMCVISVLFGKLPAIDLNNVIRISFENLPIIFAGYGLGAPIGALVGVVCDLLGCLLKGYAINPVITLGAAAVGACAGLFGALFKKRQTLSLLFSTFFAHLIGNIIIKSIGLYWWYEGMRPILIFRLPTYALIAVLEFVILLLLMKNKQIQKMLDEVKNE